MQLTGKVAMVTGASAGIGWATGEELAGMGAAVVVQARRGEKLRELVKAIAARGGKALAVEGDASREADVERLVERTLEWSRELGHAGRIDICVVNAGRGLAGGLLGSDKEQWREVFETNVLGAALLMRRVGGIMAEQQSGDVVVLGSVSGQNVSPFSGFYGASKFAIGAVTEAFRREVCGKRVRVTLVKPGIVISEFQKVAGYTEENFYRNVAKYGKPLAPVDVARVIGFIVSQEGHVHVNEVVVRPTGQDYP